MAFRTKRTIFYHIPKTGGQWVKKAILESTGGLERVPGKYITDEVKSLRLLGSHQIPATVRHDESLFSFAFVRHPLSWYRSFWASRFEDSLDKPFLISWLWDKNPEEFIRNVIRKYPRGFLTKVYRYYVGKDCNRLDFVGRQEYLADDLILALKLGRENFDEDKIKKLERINIAGTKSKYRDSFKISIAVEKSLLDSERWIINNYYDQYDGF